MCFSGVLADAVGRGVVLETGPGYQFADPALQAWLAELHGPHRKRLAVIVAAAVVTGVIVADAGSVLLRVVAASLPVAFVAACGGWACVSSPRPASPAGR